MRAQEFIEARRDPAPRQSVRDQIRAAVKAQGGSMDEYFVRFTNADKLGFSGRQSFGQTPDVDHPEFDVDRIGSGVGRRALWFYPLSYYLKSDSDTYAADAPFVWLVRLKPDAWLQTVRRGDKQLQPPPAGKKRVGMLRMSMPPAAIFFTHGFDVVDKFYNYAGQHQRHGKVKGAPPPTLMQRLRGVFR